MTKNYGVKVKIRRWFGQGENRRIIEDVLRNITEIHYNYGFMEGYGKQMRTIDEIKRTIDGGRIAFESDIQAHGLTIEIKDIVEFETEPETTKIKESD